MPIYLYTDDLHQMEISHPMDAVIVPYCPICSLAMHKKPQAPYVNWNGLPPSAENRNPVIREMINGAPKRRDEYAKLKETRS